MEIKNPFSNDTKVKTDPDPRIKAEGKAGQSTEMGVIFVMSSNFLPDPGSEWIIGTCFKSPCVAAGNNEHTDSSDSISDVQTSTNNLQLYRTLNKL